MNKQKDPLDDVIKELIEKLNLIKDDLTQYLKEKDKENGTRKNR